MIPWLPLYHFSNAKSPIVDVTFCYKAYLDILTSKGRFHIICTAYDYFSLILILRRGSAHKMMGNFGEDLEAAMVLDSSNRETLSLLKINKFPQSEETGGGMKKVKIEEI